MKIPRLNEPRKKTTPKRFSGSFVGLYDIFLSLFFFVVFSFIQSGHTHFKFNFSLFYRYDHCDNFFVLLPDGYSRPLSIKNKKFSRETPSYGLWKRILFARLLVRLSCENTRLFQDISTRECFQRNNPDK